jgi:thiol-disulfide isomerase/thioredoxin
MRPTSLRQPRALPHAALVLLCTVMTAGASGCPLRAEHGVQPAAAGAALPAPVAAPTVSPASHVHVLMINGGRDPDSNYQSHLLHVHTLLGVLQSAGVTPDHISIFNADGADPEADLAVREAESDPQLWRVSGTTLEASLSAPITFINSAVPGMELHPATKQAIGEWFDTAGTRLGPDDTLLLYVTDHGTKNSKDLTDNRITLWGKDESLSVQALQAMLEKLDPRVRVVALMSQCFSGSFAYLVRAHATNGHPSGAVCGYFSSTPERRAYGCYPENRGRDNVGHSFHFIQALAASGSFPQAQARVLVSDASPDVPLTTSDEYLHTLLGRAAGERGVSFADLVDELLNEAWKNKGAWEPEIRLLDRIGVAYGCFSPRSLAELDAQAQQLPDISAQFQTVSNAWRGTLADANQANVERFLKAHPEWTKRLTPEAAQTLDSAQRQLLQTEVLAALVPFTAASHDTAEHLDTLHEKGEAAAASTYRMEVRLAVILRMRTVLTDIAGQVYIATRATPEERAAYTALKQCEALTLPATAPGTTMLAATDPFPPFDEDVQRAQAALPAWMGIQFREASPERRKQLGLKDGAAAVMTVYPNTPAATAGLQTGDIVTGPPRHPFTHRGQIREWTMLTTAGTAHTLEVVRDDKPLQVSLKPEPYPLKWPELPGPPKLSSTAPPLVKLAAYRGTLPRSLANGSPHLLFFWATWCMPCKAALPEVLAYEKETGTQVIAITDEPPDHLDTFFKAKPGPFPQTVAVDEFRTGFVNYGVSGTPSFVLVDGKGIVRSYSSGYTPSKGLGIDGWSWAGREGQAPPTEPEGSR